MEAADALFECKARGIFRKQNIKPLVGDDVFITVNENSENTIDEICKRRNFLVRPPLSNIDNLFIVSSISDPAFNPLVVDRLVAVAEKKGINPIIVITKTDLSDTWEKWFEIYKEAGFDVIPCCNSTGLGIDDISKHIEGKISAFAGNTGVGKSSVLNSLLPELNLEVGETSKKLGRGRHTTRHCELFKAYGGYVADTPGFSSVKLEKYESITKEELPLYFREFLPFIDNCKFQTSCSHINDKGCCVRDAVEKGIISNERYESYISMYNDVKDIKQWQKK